MLPTTLENAGLQEPVKKSCVATVTKGSQLDEDRGQESDQEEEPPDTLGAHLPAPQRELTSQDQDEDLEAKTKRDDGTLERALPRRPVKMKTKIPVRVG
ncbi:unnamed protein product [Ascophyllum nodosum]